MQTNVRFWFTFEFDAAPPETIKGEVSASNLEKIFWRAAAEAKKQKPNTRWRSCVCVVERADEESSEQSVEQVADGAGESK